MGQFAKLLSKDFRVRIPTFPLIYFHIIELKYRFFYCILSILSTCSIVWYFKYILLFNLCFLDLFYTSIYEGFFSLCLFTFYISIIFNIIYIFYHILCFFQSGLYEDEITDIKENILFYILFFYFIYILYNIWLIPNILSFFIQFDEYYLNHMIRIQDFIEFYNTIFYLTIFTTLIPIIGKYISRRYLYFIIFILSAMITPPDIISLFLVSIPCIICLEISIWCNGRVV